jgi:hypothetical protein
VAVVVRAVSGSAEVMAPGSVVQQPVAAPRLAAAVRRLVAARQREAARAEAARAATRTAVAAGVGELAAVAVAVALALAVAVGRAALPVRADPRTPAAPGKVARQEEEVRPGLVEPLGVVVEAGPSWAARLIQLR